MQMPGAHNAIIPLEKVQGYLLSLHHPVGRHKARLFLSLGFSPENPDALVAEIRRIAVTSPVAKRISGPFGVKYVVDGVLRSPSGQEIGLRTIWIREKGHRFPRLVTAYPIG